jgi:hypothetical protein
MIQHISSTRKTIYFAGSIFVELTAGEFVKTELVLLSYILQLMGFPVEAISFA